MQKTELHGGNKSAVAIPEGKKQGTKVPDETLYPRLDQLILIIYVYLVGLYAYYNL